MKRHPGWGYVQEVLASEFAHKGFPRMRNPTEVTKCLIRYLHKGKFSSKEMRDFLPVLHNWYSVYCRQHGIKYSNPPPSLLRKMGEY